LTSSAMGYWRREKLNKPQHLPREFTDGISRGSMSAVLFPSSNLYIIVDLKLEREPR